VVPTTLKETVIVIRCLDYDQLPVLLEVTGKM
jgi:hypothetical protein